MPTPVAARLALAFATPSLAPALARIDRLAFQHTALYRALYQSVPKTAYEQFRAAQLANEMHPWYYERGRRVLAAWLDEHSPSQTPTLAGYLSWEEVKPGRVLSLTEGAWARPVKPAVPDEAWTGVKEDVFGRVAAEAFGIELGHRLYLVSLAVDPAYQRRGVATALLQNALNRADAAGLPAYLHAAPEAAALYLKLAFAPCGPDIVAQDGSFRLTPMMRPAPRAKV